MKRFTNPFARLGGKDQTALIFDELAELRRDVERLELDMVEFRGELDSFYRSSRGSQVSFPPPPDPEHLLDLGVNSPASGGGAAAAAAVPRPKPSLVETIPPKVKTALGEWGQTTVAEHPPANFGAAAASRLYVVQEPKIRFKQRGEFRLFTKLFTQSYVDSNSISKHFKNVLCRKQKKTICVSHRRIRHLRFRLRPLFTNLMGGKRNLRLFSLFFTARSDRSAKGDDYPMVFEMDRDDGPPPANF